MDKAGPEWLKECLARHICRIRPVNKRKEFLRRWEKRNGAESVINLKTLVRKQWAIMKDKKNV